MSGTRELPAHGTNSRYSYHGCRCQPCRDGMAAERRDRRRRGPEKVPTVQARRAIRLLTTRYGWSRNQIAAELGLSTNTTTLVLKHHLCTRRVSDALCGLLADTEAQREGDRRRYPYAPLAAELASRGYRSILAQAAFLDLDARQIHRWLELGIGLPDADRIAISLGRHPSYFWPDYFAAVAA